MVFLTIVSHKSITFATQNNKNIIIMKKTLLLLTVLLYWGTTFLPAAKVNKSINIEVNGEQRSYWLYVPTGIKGEAPLVVAMHGAGGHSNEYRPGWNEIADREKFIVVYPQGKDIFFPVFGGYTPGWDASGEENEDVAFIRAIVQDVASKYDVDSLRCYACGFSNGGMMTYALSNTCSDLFAAFASISGFPLNEFHLHHVSHRPVPFLHIHGKEDNFVRYALMPVIVDEMVARLGANPVPVKTSVSGKYDKSVYEAMEGSFPYIYYEINDMGHNDYTANTEDGNSTKTMWNFFKQYTLDAACDTSLIWIPRLETEDFAPKKHGFTVNSGTTLVKIGGDQKTDANQNVYHSLQLTTGIYKICFRTTGEADNSVRVKLEKISDKKTKTIISTKVPTGEFTRLPFEITDGWGEYRLAISRISSTDQVTLTDLEIRTASESELTAVTSPRLTPHTTSAPTQYTLSGIRPSTTHRGLVIINQADGRTRKVLMK